MTIDLTDNPPRISYTVGQGVTTTSFDTDFEFFDDNNVVVVLDGVTKTLNNDYTISGGNGAVGTVTMTVTGASGGSTVILYRDIPLKRTTDFPISGAFPIATLNTELDRIIALFDDRQDRIDRSVKLLDTDDTATMTVPTKANRLGKVLAFNATNGNLEAGPTIANVNSLADITTNINTVAGIHGNVTTVAGKASLITSSFATQMGLIDATFVTKMGLVTNTFVTKMGLVTSDFVDDMAVITQAVVDDIAIVSEINTTHLSNVSGVASHVTTLGAISGNITTVANNSSNITTIANTLAQAYTVTVANSKFVLNGVSQPALTMYKGTTYTFDVSDNSVTSGNHVLRFATESDGGNNSGYSNGVDTTQSGKVIITVQTDAPSTLYYYCTAHSGMGNSIEVKESTFSLIAAGLNNFSARYRVDSSQPTTSLDNGDLYFDTTTNKLNVYNGASWSAIGEAATITRTVFPITGNTTLFNASSSPALPAYTAGLIDVYLNGVKLVHAANGNNNDFTATNGTSITLTSAATNGDVLEVVAFSPYNASNFGTASGKDTGISQNNVPIFASGVADNDFLKIDGTTVEGRDASQVLTDIGAAALAGATFTGEVNVNGGINEKNTDVTSSSGTLNLSMHNGNNFCITTTEAVTTINFNDFPTDTNSVFFLTLKVVYGGTHALTFPSQVKWAGGTPPVTGTNGTTDIFAFYHVKESGVNAGTKIWGTVVGQAFS